VGVRKLARLVFRDRAVLTDEAHNERLNRAEADVRGRGVTEEGRLLVRHAEGFTTAKIERGSTGAENHPLSRTAIHSPSLSATCSIAFSELNASTVCS